jgi:hypothetical protein
MRQSLSAITFFFFSQAILRSFTIAHIHTYFSRFYPIGIFGGAIRFIDLNKWFDQGGVLRIFYPGWSHLLGDSHGWSILTARGPRLPSRPRTCPWIPVPPPWLPPRLIVASWLLGGRVSPSPLTYINTDQWIKNDTQVQSLPLYSLVLCIPLVTVPPLCFFFSCSGGCRRFYR